MNAIDQFPQTVAWSAEVDTYVGYCPAFFAGGVCHGDDPVEVLRELRGLIEGELQRYIDEGLTLPAASSLPAQTVGILEAA